MKFRHIALAASIAASTLLLAACGSSSSNKDSKVTTVKISWRATGKNDTLSKVYSKKFISDFEKKHPDIKIKLVPIVASEGDYFSKIDLALKSSDTTPDIVSEDLSMLPSDAKAGYLAPIDSYVSKWSDWKNYTKSLIGGSEGSDGKLYGIPATTDSRGLWTNLNALKKAGISPNWTPKNWDDLLTASKKMKTAGVKVPFAMGVSTTNGEAVSMQTFEQLLYGTGETLYNDKTGKWNVNSKGITDSLKFVNQVFNVDKTGPSLSLAMNSNFTSNMTSNLFPKNQVGFLLDGTWDSSSYWVPNATAPIKNLQKNVALNLMPTKNGKNGGSVTMAGGWAWSLAKNSTHKKAAFEVMKAMNSKEMSLKRVQADGSLTTRNDVAKDKDYLSRPFMKEATAALQNAYFRPKSDLYPKVSIAIQKMVEDVASGQKSVKEASAKYTSDVKSIVGAKNTTTQK